MSDERVYDEWLRLFANRNDVADVYATGLRYQGVAWDGWQNINAAILRRWSPAGLKYIKTRAWKIATGNL
jgi:hypothetical protein